MLRNRAPSRFLTRGGTDLIEIWAFVAADDIRQADRLIDRIRDSCKVLTRAVHRFLESAAAVVLSEAKDLAVVRSKNVGTDEISAPTVSIPTPQDPSLRSG